MCAGSFRIPVSDVSFSMVPFFPTFFGEGSSLHSPRQGEPGFFPHGQGLGSSAAPSSMKNLGSLLYEGHSTGRRARVFGFNALFGLDIGPPREGAERVLQFTFLRTLRNPSKKEASTWVCLKAFTPKQRNGVHFLVSL